MLIDNIYTLNIFKLYHPSKSITGQAVRGSGNNLIALAALGIILLLIAVLIFYLRKKYKQKYNY